MVLNILRHLMSSHLFFRYYWLNLRERGRILILKNTFFILLGFHMGTRILGICKGFAKVLGDEKNAINP